MRLLHSFIVLALTIAQATAPQQQPGSQPNTQQNQPVRQQPKPTPTPKPETFWQKLLRITGISATPSAMKGGEEKLAGDLWIIDLNTRTSRRVTRNGGYSSPVFLPGEQRLLALKGEEVVEIPFDGGAGKVLFKIKGVTKLVGVSMDQRDQVLLLTEDEQSPAKLLSLGDGRVTALPFDKNSDEDRKMLAHARGWERVYNDGKVSLYTRTETKDGLAGAIEWSDVYLKQESQEPVNISNCDGANCGQPALSADARYVIYIKQGG